jgi:hypothetical protein
MKGKDCQPFTLAIALFAKSTPLPIRINSSHLMLCMSCLFHPAILNCWKPLGNMGMDTCLQIVLFIGIILTSHLEHGFFMNWFGNQQGEGYEFHLLVIGLAIATLINGSGKYSVDNFIEKQN